MTEYETLVIRLISGASRLVNDDLFDLIQSMEESGKKAELHKRFMQLDHAVNRILDYNSSGK